MKKVFFTLALLVFSIATYAQATEPSGCTMSVANIEILPGNSAKFDINLESSARSDINTFQVYVNIPAGWELTEPTTTARTSGYTVDNPSDNGSEIRFYVYGYHGQGKVISGTDGSIITLTLTAPDDVVVGDTYTITCDGAMLSNGGAELDVDDFEFKVKISDHLTLDENSPTPFADADGVDVTVNRTLKGGIWNSIILPFEVDDPEAVFGEGVLVAEFNGINCEGVTTSNLTTNKIEISFGLTDFMEAEQAYIVKPVNDITSFNVDGVDVAWADNPNQVIQTNGKSGKKYQSKFTGTYVANTTIPENSIFLSDNKFYVATNATKKMKAFRAYFTPIFNDQVVTLSESTEVKVVFGDEETSIDSIGENIEDGKIYSIDGKFVGKNVSRLHKGVYVVNGKKIIK